MVAADGSGDYDTGQAAIDAIPSDGLQYTIEIEPGTYPEAITVPASKANLLIRGPAAMPPGSSSPQTGEARRLTGTSTPDWSGA
ncbi:pectinesterase family protein [Streptomyces sp. STR69]|uniref:pectinesterase family protein n=1 Tax=Streptomyces sp. STR69 TaxID=1796942 RepID=UPI0021C73C9A|nr:pectinesterase family protein [Streptomyces sp. STR69]